MKSFEYCLFLCAAYSKLLTYYKHVHILQNVGLDDVERRRVYTICASHCKLVTYYKLGMLGIIIVIANRIVVFQTKYLVLVFSGLFSM